MDTQQQQPINRPDTTRTTTTTTTQSSDGFTMLGYLSGLSSYCCSFMFYVLIIALVVLALQK